MKNGVWDSQPVAICCRVLSAICSLLFLLYSWPEQEIDNIADVLFIG